MQAELFFAAFLVLEVAGDELRIPHAFLEAVEDFPAEERHHHLCQLLPVNAFAKLPHHSLRGFAGLKRLLHWPRVGRLQVASEQVEQLVWALQLPKLEAYVVEVVPAIRHEHQGIIKTLSGNTSTFSMRLAWRLLSGGGSPLLPSSLDGADSSGQRSVRWG